MYEGGVYPEKKLPPTSIIEHFILNSSTNFKLLGAGGCWLGLDGDSLFLFPSLSSNNHTEELTCSTDTCSVSVCLSGGGINCLLPTCEVKLCEI